MIYYFPDLRGKCAKRTLREIILLGAVASAAGDTGPYSRCYLNPWASKRKGDSIY